MIWSVQEDGKFLRKSNKDNKFPPLKCSSCKTSNVYTKIKGLYYASKNLICEGLPKGK